MTIPTPPHRHAIGITRRELLQVGYSGLLGVGLANMPTARAGSKPGGSPPPLAKPKSVIIIFQTGAASHIDTLDPKPDAPAEIRGEFGVIPTKTPGMMFTEHLPLLAARSDTFAVVRSLSHRDNNHLVATHHVLTGQQQPGAFFDKVASRDDWPAYSAGLNYFRPRSDGIPSGINLPTFLMDGPLTWPGQHAGILGPRHDPWQISQDPNKPDFKVDNLRIAPGVDVDQLSDRMALLAQVNKQQRWLEENADGKKLTDQQDRAVKLLTSGKVAKAFEIEKEPAAVRDRYGRHAFGQSILLAKRLSEAGVPVVQANMGKVQNWDTHGDGFNALKKRLLPPLDAGVAALLDDLSASGRLDETLVVVIGEFGRTPKVTVQRDGQKPGRDHWAPCFSAIFAGGGVRGGQVIGKSDKIGGYPTTPPYSPNDVGATVYSVLGIDPHAEVRDRLDRPVQLNRGQVMSALFTGA